MRRYIRFVIAHPLLVLGVLAIITAYLAPGLGLLTFNNALEAFMPRDDRDYLQNEAAKEIYGDNSRFFIIEVSGKAMTPAFFGHVETLVEDLEAYKDYPSMEMDAGLKRLTDLAQEPPASAEALLEDLSSWPLFQRLVARKLDAGQPLGTEALDALVLSVKESLALMAEAPVKRVVSPMSVSDIRAEGDDLFTGKLLEEDDDGKRIMPATGDDVSAVLERMRANPAFRHGIYAENAQGEITDFGIVVTFSKRPRVDRISREVIAICEAQQDLKVMPQGSPVVNVRFNTYMQKDLRRFLPLVVLVMGVTFFINFRSPLGFLLPLCSLVLSTVWIMGLMGRFGYSITPLGISLPPLMVSVGSSYAIHIYNQFLADSRLMEEKGFSEGLCLAMEHISQTVLFAGVTTMIAFATLATSRLSAVREWGLLSAVGVVFSVILASSLIPAILTLVGKVPQAPVRKRRRHPVDRCIHLFSWLVTRHPRKVVAGTVLVLGLCVVGMYRLEVESDFLLYFKKNDEIRVSARAVGEKFKGRSGFNLLIDSGTPGGVLDPAFLKQVEAIRRELTRPERADWCIGRTDSLTDFLMVMHRAMNGDDPAFYRLPDSAGDVLDYFEIYGGEDDNDDGRPDEFEAYVDPDWQVMNLLCRLYSGDGASVGTTRTGRIMGEIEAWLDNALPQGGSAHITGFPKIDVKVTDYIVKGQLSSLLLSLGVIFGIVLVRFRSVHAALLSMVPMGAAVMINFGIMGWFGVHLDMLTSIIASITIGIGVDDTIHFLLAYRHHAKANLSKEESLLRTLAVSGRAISYTSLALVVGFLVLATSNFVAVVLFGLLMAVTMTATTIGALLVLPSLILLTGFYPRPAVAEGMAPKKVDRLISLFRSLENRPGAPKRIEEPNLPEQSEEAYQKEQAAWLAEVKKRKEKNGK
ncbi:efflux RND transporter permease subunit [Desulfoluna butyratoxydans]|uniref:Membrane transport protein mmpl domain n=1 Tax=Desulfoluna butyratoxydans TaxID=231438 RepID=A0A4U8YPW2_9BACT|nr:MMPL family transporter [Desulfoluna butyratoxydans]VFQ43742.1 membrane transport protein mmpl domain [Desulfoluna butyratoxydans]